MSRYESFYAAAKRSDCFCSCLSVVVVSPSDSRSNTDLVDLQVGVGRDDGASREVDALAHEVATDAALLALETLRDRLEHCKVVAGDRGR